MTPAEGSSGAPLTRKALVLETRLKGCAFGKAAIEGLERHLRAHGLDGGYRETVRAICNKLKDLGDPGTVTPEALQRAIDALGAREKEPDRIAVINAPDVPRFVYDASRRVFRRTAPSNAVAGTAQDKAALYRDRYDVLLQRVLRSDLFVRPAFEPRAAGGKFEVRTVSSLEGTAAGQPVTVLGSLYRRQEDTYVLEDAQNSVVVNLDNVKYTAGLFVDGCFVLAQGLYENGVLHAAGVGFPPAEPRAQSLAALPHTADFFGAADRAGANPEAEAACGAKFIVLSDAFLLEPKVIQRLRSLLGAFAAEGAAEDPAALHFVLVGNFVEAPFNYGDCGSLSQVAQSERARYTSGLDRLADLIAEFPAIAASSHFILVPGPNDPTFGGFILPQPPLPQTFTAALRKKVAHVTLATNPCRIRFFSQELIVFRDDLYRKARRHCLPALPPIGSEEPHNHLVKTLVDQAHLSPVPVTVTPVYWAQDHALRLFPLPDMVVVCGGGESWETEYMGCPFLNPGSFSRNRTFLIHQPAQRHSQFQQMK